MDDTCAWLAAAISENAEFLASGMGRWIEAATSGGGTPATRLDFGGDVLLHLVDWLSAEAPQAITAGRARLAAMWGPDAALPERMGGVACSAVMELLRESGLWDAAGPEHRRNARFLLDRFFREPRPADAAHLLPHAPAHVREIDPLPEAVLRRPSDWGDSPRSGGDSPQE